MQTSRKLLVLTGPSGSGKGAVAFELARRAGYEIVSLDSMKVYREMDLGTAKPAAEQRRAVRYHLLDMVGPEEDFSVGDYLRLFSRALEDIESRGARALVAGGTALYLKALVEGLRPGPGADWELRARLRAEAAAQGGESLHARLRGVDPAAAAKIDPRDLRRIVRALEVVELTGEPLSRGWTWGRSGARERDRGGSVHFFTSSGFRLVGLEWDREALYRRIDRRVERMVALGLFEEAQRLRERHPPLGRSAGQCIGYKEIFAGLDRGRSREEITARIQQRTRQLAKHQLTWFRKLPVEWIPVAEPFDAAGIAGEIRRGVEAP